MAMATASKTKTTITAEQFYRKPNHGGRHELVQGEMVPMSPAGPTHGKIALRLGATLWQFVQQHDLGEVYAAETGFTILENPDTVRAPDVAFVARERIPPTGEPDGFWRIAPDLVVEVLFPYDKASQVQDKITDYLTAGVRLLWLVDPHSQTVTVYESLDRVKILIGDDTLDGGDVLPDFALPLLQLFM
jgi:Uma2 family endonuclease